jgi:hypothetical protein
MEQAPFVVSDDGVPNLSAMKKTSFLVAGGIPGIAAKDEFMKVNEHGILIGRWLPLSKYPLPVESRHLLRVFTQSHYAPLARPLRQPGV